MTSLPPYMDAAAVGAAKAEQHSTCIRSWGRIKMGHRYVATCKD